MRKAMPRGWKLLGISLLILVSGLFLFASSTVQEVSSSGWSSTSSGALYNSDFTYSDYTVNFESPRQITIGTSGIADLIILSVPFREFNNWVCHESGYDTYQGGCNTFGGGTLNVTILFSYLQTHQSHVAYSRTIANQNVTIDYRLIPVTDGTIVLAPVGPGISNYYWRTSQTNQTIYYPIIGYDERPGIIWSLANISYGVIALGTIILLLAVIQVKSQPPNRSGGYKLYQGSTTQKCNMCGHENLFFAEKCSHCGGELHKEPPRAKTRIDT